jgi:hypothetical protein
LYPVSTTGTGAGLGGGGRTGSGATSADAGDTAIAKATLKTDHRARIPLPSAIPSKDNRDIRPYFGA